MKHTGILAHSPDGAALAFTEYVIWGSPDLKCLSILTSQWTISQWDILCKIGLTET
ncbi:MAG: hypothetical protein ABJN65_17870 [Parasphingorhabdus sp.]